MRLKLAIFLPLLAACCGCPAWQGQDTSAPAIQLTEKGTGAEYWCYVPKDYKPTRAWAMAVTLHGTPPFDGPERQIDEWKRLAEDKQFIVVAPSLTSAQSMLLGEPRDWLENLRRDEQTILAVIDEMCARYRIDRGTILLHGYSTGGYALYYVALRNPKLFIAAVARGCNCRSELLEKIEITDEARKLPLLVLSGKEESRAMREQSWLAYRFLRERRCFQAKRKDFRGGLVRRPDLAYEFWREHMPKGLRG